MSRVCDICGKGNQFGHQVSHANNKSQKIWYPNIQKVRVVVNGQHKRLRVCTSCLSAERVQKIA